MTPVDNAAPTFTFPDAGSTLGGAIQIFRWDLGGVPLEAAWLYLGTSAGGSQYASRSVGTDTEISIGDLPVDGSDVFARLWFKVGGLWSFIDRRFKAAASPGLPFLVDPPAGATLAGPTQAFAWSYGGLEVENSWLYLGSVVGGSDHAAVQVGTRRELTVGGLPLDGSTVHVRLFFRAAGVWHHVDTTYVAATDDAPTRDELTRELQGLVGVTADGVIGPITRAALNQNWLGRSEAFDPSFAARFTNDADVVSWVQRRLNRRNGLNLEVDGVYGENTADAVDDDLDRGGVVAAESYELLLDP